MRLVLADGLIFAMSRRDEAAATRIGARVHARAPESPQIPAPPAPGRRSYARALAHSRRVRLLKRAIPIGAAGAVALVLAVAFVDPFAAQGGLSIGPVNVSGTRIVMDSPRLSGFQEGSRPYEVTATEASQDVREPHLVDLVDLRARVSVDAAGNVVRVEAARGRLDTQTERLELEQDVRITSTLGYTADLASALVDFAAGSVVSQEPVRVGVGSGVIEAQTLSLADGGEVITFVGGVTSTFLLGADGDADAPRAADARSAVP